MQASYPGVEGLGVPFQGAEAGLEGPYLGVEVDQGYRLVVVEVEGFQGHQGLEAEEEHLAGGVHHQGEVGVEGCRLVVGEGAVYRAYQVAVEYQACLGVEGYRRAVVVHLSINTYLS